MVRYPFNEKPGSIFKKKPFSFVNSEDLRKIKQYWHCEEKRQYCFVYEIRDYG